MAALLTVGRQCCVRVNHGGTALASKLSNWEDLSFPSPLALNVMLCVFDFQTELAGHGQADKVVALEA